MAFMARGEGRRATSARAVMTPAVAQALQMLEAFASVGVKAFDLTMTSVTGDKLPRGFQANRSVDQLRRMIGHLLESAARARENIILRPRSSGPTMIQLDDLDTAAVDRISPYAFMVLCTSPGNFQAWVAVKDAPADFARRLRKGAGADPSASGATRVAGSLNFKTKYAPAFPMVEIKHQAAGRTVTPAELESAGLVAPAEAPPRVSFPASGRRRAGKARRWPSYEICVQNAPLIHQGDRPDISRADFTWCMMAIDWGHSVEATAERLMEYSTKAQENGEPYALTTAQNAAAAVDRRRAPAKSTPQP